MAQQNAIKSQRVPRVQEVQSGEFTRDQWKEKYLAHGKVDFLVKRESRIPMVPGARIELATPAFSGRRSTTELPRHLLFRNCMGCGAIVSIRSAYAI
jgi:hypothetical protein